MASLNAWQQAQKLFNQVGQGVNNLIKPQQANVNSMQTFNRGVQPTFRPNPLVKQQATPINLPQVAQQAIKIAQPIVQNFNPINTLSQGINTQGFKPAQITPFVNKIGSAFTSNPQFGQSPLGQGLQGNFGGAINAFQKMATKSFDPTVGLAEIKRIQGKPLNAKEQLALKTSNSNAVNLATGTLAGPEAKGFQQATGKFAPLFDKMTRFEIPDNLMKLKKSGVDKLAKGGLLKLSEIIDHPELFKNYPDLKNILVNKTEAQDLLGGLSGKRMSLNLKQSTKELKDTILHETQHAIQGKEGFATGGTPNMFKNNEKQLMQQIETLNQHMTDLVHSNDRMDKFTQGEMIASNKALYQRLLSQRDELTQKIIKSQDEYGRAGHGAYKNLAGEAEARAVGQRRIFTPKQRASIDPYSSQGLTMDNAVVNFNKGASGKLNPVANAGFYDTPFKNITDNQNIANSKASKVVMMSPDEYIQTINKNTKGRVDFNTGNKDTIAKYVDEMRNGKKFNMPNVDLTNGTQEGSHRALAAKELGIQQIPVTVIDNRVAEQPIGDTKALKVDLNKTNPKINLSNINVPDINKQKLGQTVDEVRPQIEKAIGTKLSNKEIINFAGKTSKVLDRSVGKEQTLQFSSALLKARQNLAAAAKSGVVDQDYIDNLMTVKTQATDIARKLQSFSIGADPSTTTYKDKILQAVLEVSNNTDQVLKAAQGVDFNNANQAANFYRQFVKPTKGEWIDLLRYNSMLSSPLTHIVNATSNLINSGIVAPIEKTTTGLVDFLNPIRVAKGQPQTHFATEGGAYLKGYVSKVGSAAQKFADVVRGKAVSGNLDINQIPLGTKGLSGKTANMLSTPTRFLEASDQFFTALTQGGEEAALKLRQSKGVNVGNVETQSLNNAKYRLFRSDLHTPEQGHLLNAVDDLTSKVQFLRTAKNPVTSTIAKFTIPFLKTPMNIIKQGIEYSPAGFGTIPGAADKTEQLSKAILGTTGAAMAAMFISSGRTTWAEPVDPAGRARFRAAGLQPYSIKLGDKWVSFQKLNPALSFPLAFMAAIHDAESKKTIDQSQTDAIMSAMAKFGNFYSDQSYLKNIGDLVSATKGNPEQMTQFIGNYPQQLVPYRALLGWMARLSDPIQRKVDTNASYWDQQVQNLLINIPFADRAVPARVDQFGQPIPNQNQLTNAVSPFKVTTERPEQKQIYDTQQQKSLFDKNMKAAKVMIQEGKPVNFGDIASASDSTPKITQGQKPDLQAKLKDDINKQKVKLTGQTIEENGRIYYPKGSSAHVIDLNEKIKTPVFSGQTELDKKALSIFNSTVNRKINEVTDLITLGKLQPAEAEQLIEGLRAKQQQLKDKLNPPTQYNLTGNPTIDKYVVTQQKASQTKQINSIVDRVEKGALSANEGETLINSIKNTSVGRVSVGKKPKKLHYKVAKVPKVKLSKARVSLKLPKVKIPKYKKFKVKR